MATNISKQLLLKKERKKERKMKKKKKKKKKKKALFHKGKQGNQRNIFCHNIYRTICLIVQS